MIDIRAHGEIRELCMTRPPVNAMSPALVAELIAALNAAARESRAVVLSGLPGMFSAGLDVRELLTLARDNILPFWRDFFTVMRTLAESPVPVVAAITGHSPAGGAVMALFCDYRIAADGEFRIGFNEVQVGLPVPAFICQALAVQIGPRRAEQMLTRGLLLNMRAAVDAGIVDEVVAPDQVVTRALDHARELLALPPVAYMRTRSVARAPLMDVFAELKEADYARVADTWFSDETQAIMRELVERLARKKRGE